MENPEPIPPLKSYTEAAGAKVAYVPEVGDFVRVRYNPTHPATGDLMPLATVVGKVVEVHTPETLNVEVAQAGGDDPYLFQSLSRKRKGVSYPAWRPKS